MGKRVGHALRIARLKKDDGGGVDAGYDPFAAEKFAPEQLAPPSADVIRNWATNWQRPADQGNVQFTTASPYANITDQDIDRGIGVAMSAGTGTIGGPLAKTADHVALARAQQMATSGADETAIWNATGWFRGADGKWRFEIPDQTSYWKTNPNELATAKEPAVLGDTFEHSELYKAYPELYGTDLNVQRMGMGTKGSYQRGYALDAPTLTLSPDSPARMRSTALHELQHGIQNIEGTATGGNTFGLKPGTPAWDIYQERLKAIRTPTPEAELEKAGVLGPDYTYNDYLREHKQTLRNDNIGLDRAAQEYAVQEAYKRLAGETEARNVQRRADMTPEELRNNPPTSTQDYPNDKQFVRFADPGISESKEGIRAYHGSPHDFDKFDINRIGTGEGAQAYGHGLYFAENEGTAKAYRDALSDSARIGNQQTAMGAADRFVNLYGDGAADAIKREIATMQTQAQKLKDAGKGVPQVFLDRIKNEYEPALEMVNKGYKPGGRMYEVSIAADPEHFLDWDKPLSEQGGQIAEAIGKVAPDYAALLEQRDPYMMNKNAGTLVDSLRQNYEPAQVSQALREAGIPGIKYLDQGSRSAGGGSRNYVVFDHNLINILRKYGIVGAPAAAMAARIARGSNDTDMRRGGAVKTALISARL